MGSCEEKENKIPRKNEDPPFYAFYGGKRGDILKSCHFVPKLWV
jgi:hypothetical protein